MAALRKTKTKRLNTVAELAAHFHCTWAGARKWTRLKGFPGGQHGPWYSDRIERFFVRRQAASGANGDGGDSLKDQLLAEQVRRLRLANDLAEGRLCDRAETELELREKFLRIKSRLEFIPSEIEMELPPEVRIETKVLIENRIYLVLQELASWAKSPVPESTDPQSQELEPCPQN